MWADYFDFEACSSRDFCRAFNPLGICTLTSTYRSPFTPGLFQLRHAAPGQPEDLFRLGAGRNGQETLPARVLTSTSPPRMALKTSIVTWVCRSFPSRSKAGSSATSRTRYRSAGLPSDSGRTRCRYPDFGALARSGGDFHFDAPVAGLQGACGAGIGFLQADGDRLLCGWQAPAPAPASHCLHRRSSRRKWSGRNPRRSHRRTGR